jgi:acetyl esterase/lipase
LAESDQRAPTSSTTVDALGSKVAPGTLARPSGRHVRGPLLISAAVFSLGGAAVYLAVLPALLQASPLYGGVFAVAGLAQVGLAVGLLLAPARGRLVAAVAVSLAVLAVWVLAHTVVLPGPNPWLPLDTTVGITDWLCAALEAIAALLLGWAALRWPRGPRVRRRVLVVLASVPPLLLAALLTFGGVALATDGFTGVTRAGGPAPTSPSAGGRTTVTYCTQHGTALAMDVYQPPAGAARPAPVALYVHGGGFLLGNRKPSGLGAGLGRGQPGALFEPLRGVLGQRGMVVASIDYRLAPLSRWPAALEDVKCAVRFLRAHARALGIDPGRIGAWGSSAGGDLVSLLGVVGPRAGLDQGQYADQPSRVEDATDLHDSEPFMRTVVHVALGGSSRVRRAVSPGSYLGTGANTWAGAVGGLPPFLILHGTDDQAIRPRHSQAFARQLEAAGVPVELVLVQGAQHGLNYPSQRPTPAQLTERVANFLTDSLARGSGR